ncbi:MBL fold metallo-hydrolase [Pseudomonas aeruginosa]
MSASFSAPRLRPRQLSAGDLVEESLLDPANDYLRIVRARQPGMDLRQWIAAAGAGLRDSLLRHGGILFRGFAVDGAEGFSQAVQSFSPNMLDYLERAAARQEVAHRVFTSTEFSPDGWIPPHHEMSYSHNWPSYIHFYCQTPPATQGRTPLADERRVSARIPEAIRQRFLRHGVCYVRNYGPEIDLTWQEGFQTDSRAELDATVDGSLFRLGHSTLLLKLAGSWWLTDPVFSERASPLPFAGPKRFHAPPVALADLPPIRGVILSHDHYDHLDRAAIKALVPLVELFLAPLGVGDRLLAWGVPPGKVRQLDWWQGIEAGGLRLTATPAQHFSGRGLHDGNRTLWCSWVIESAELKLFFSGDSGYFDGFAEIGRRYGPFDLTMLETGAYNEHWPYVHMHPQQTLQAHRDLGGRWLLPIHNGTFDLAMHAWYEPFERILELATEHGVRVSTPMMGERIDLQAPHAGRRWWREVVDSETQVQGYGCCRS